MSTLSCSAKIGVILVLSTCSQACPYYGEFAIVEAITIYILYAWNRSKVAGNYIIGVRSGIRTHAHKHVLLRRFCILG